MACIVCSVPILLTCTSTNEQEKVPRCGDGVIDFGEACDDGNTEPGDGCRADCRGIEVCGDGLLDELCEECDDGRETANCDADCKARRRFVPVTALLILLGARKNAHADSDLSAIREEPRTGNGERTWLPQVGIKGAQALPIFWQAQMIGRLHWTRRLSSAAALASSPWSGAMHSGIGRSGCKPSSCTRLVRAVCELERCRDKRCGLH